MPGCSKEESNTPAPNPPAAPTADITPPVITITGVNPVTVSLNGAYTDDGATAFDNVNGAVSVTSNFSSTNPDINLTGTYSVTYTAADSIGNVATATRTIIVRNDAYYLEGTYLCDQLPPSFTWTQSITASSTINNRIIFSKFSNYSNNNQIYAQVLGSGVNITTQNAVNIGVSGCTHTFAPNGTGNAVSGTSGSYTFSIKFTDMQLAGGAGCPATGAVPYEDIFVQQ